MGLRYRYSTNSGQSFTTAATISGTGSSYNSPSSAFNPVITPESDKANIAYATNTGYTSQMHYKYHNFLNHTWSSSTVLSSVLPSGYIEHKDPSLATSSTSYSTVHVAWESTLNPSTPVIIHRKGSPGNFGSQYYIIQYQSANNPSISGLVTDDAWMVFQNSSGGGFSKIKYSGTWGSPTYVSSGNYAQLSVGSTSAKYLWTSGSSSPYTISIGTETLTKEEPIALTYSRELNLLLPSGNEDNPNRGISFIIDQPKIVNKDGTVSFLPFIDAPPDTIIIPANEILKYGNTKPFTPLPEMDTLKFQLTIKSFKAAEAFKNAEGLLSIDILDENTGNSINKIRDQIVALNSDLNTNQLDIKVPANQIQNLKYENNGISIGISFETKTAIPGIFASLGHIYNFDETDLGNTKETASEETNKINKLTIQNYPNPFNPLTKFNFTLPRAGHITLSIYDILGRKVIDLINSNLNEGLHEYEFDASTYPSGIYFYMLDFENEKSISRKMLLLK